MLGLELWRIQDLIRVGDEGGRGVCFECWSLESRVVRCSKCGKLPVFASKSLD